MSKLCQKFDVQSYPSIFSIGAGAATNTMNNVGNMMFSVKKIEKALGLTQTTLPARELETTDDGVDGKPNNRGDSAKDDAVEGETTTEGQEDEQDGGAKNGDAEDDEENQKKENEGNVEEDEEEAPGVDEEAESDVGNIGERLGGEAVDDDKEMSKDTDFNFSEEKIPRIPVRPKAGAEVAKNGERAMDKWKEIQKQRIREKEYKMLRQKKAKPGSIGNELINNSGATAIMLANRRGTDQFNARQKDLLAVLTRMQSAQHRKHEEMLKRMKRGELVFKKHVTKPRFVEAVPIVKRAVKMTAEEQLILDASLSFREGLRVGVYKSMKPLVPKEKHALKNWLELLRISLPPEWALLETIDELDENIHRISQSPHDLITVLAKRPFPRTKWSKSCGRGNGFTCGFWKLLHIMTIGVAEHRGGRDLVDAGTVRENTRLFSPMEAANTVREYIVNFFPCTDCAQHFVAQYDQCNMNRRCDRLAGDAASATDADWKELARWLWEFHNDVNVRVLNKKLDDQRKIGPGGATMAEQVNVLWPSLDSCVTCIDEDGSFNEEGVFLYMEQTYW